MSGLSHKFKEFLSGSGLKTIVFKALNLNILNSLLPLFTSYCIFVTINREFVGFYQMILAVAGFGELFLAGIDVAISRFWTSKEVPDEDKKGILQLVFEIKFIVTLSFLSLLFLLSLIPNLALNVLPEKAQTFNYQPYFYIALVVVLVNGMYATLMKCFVANGMFRYMFRLTFIREMLAAVIISFLLFRLETGYLPVLLTQLGIYTLVLCFNVQYVFKKKEKFYIAEKLYSLKNQKRIFQLYLKDYSLPITFSSVLTYTKNQLPKIILGYAGENGLVLSANYGFLQNIFRRIHKLSSGYLSLVRPKFINMKEESSENFSRKFNLLFRFSFLFRSCIALGVFFLGWVLLKLLGIEYHYQFILNLFALELLAADLSTFNAEVILLGKDTRYLFRSALVRAIVELPLIFWLALNYGAEGAVCTLLVSRLVEGLVLIQYASKMNVLVHQRKFALLLISVSALFIFFHFR